MVRQRWINRLLPLARSLFPFSSLHPTAMSAARRLHNAMPSDRRQFRFGLCVCRGRGLVASSNYVGTGMGAHVREPVP
jgi:hypothetical protein